MKPEVVKILEQCIELYTRKSGDYNHPTRGQDALANFRTSVELGVEPYLGALVRMNDKWERIKSLTYKLQNGKAPSVKDETIEDTLLDIIVYGAIVLALYREQSVIHTHTHTLAGLYEHATE